MACHPRKQIPLEDRFWSKVAKSDGCWLWTGGLSHGYGRIYIETLADGRKRFEAAHRVSYMLLVGPIPSGAELDHLCRNPACVNPAHLEPVTHQENILRGNYGGDSQTKRAWTHCKHEHEFTPENTLIERATGKRRCRTCKNRLQLEAWRRRQNVEA